MTTDTGEFAFERQFSIPPNQLWHLLTDAKMRENWGAPGPDQVLTMLTSDFRVGGLEQHRCGPEDNPEFSVDTRWYRIVAPSDAVFTETITIGDEPLATSLVTYRVTPRDAAGSNLDVTVAVSSFVGPDAPMEFRDGWKGGLDNLEALAKRQAA